MVFWRKSLQHSVNEFPNGILMPWGFCCFFFPWERNKCVNAITTTIHEQLMLIYHVWVCITDYWPCYLCFVKTKICGLFGISHNWSHTFFSISEFRGSSRSDVVFSDMKRLAWWSDAYRVTLFPISLPVLIRLYKELNWSCSNCLYEIQDALISSVLSSSSLHLTDRVPHLLWCFAWIAVVSIWKKFGSQITFF